jgi:hypothetical protein
MLIMPFHSSKVAVTTFHRVVGVWARGGDGRALHVASRPSNHHLLINSSTMTPAITTLFRSPVVAAVPSSSALSTPRLYDGPGNNLVRPRMFDSVKGLMLSPKECQPASTIIMLSDPR